MKFVTFIQHPFENTTRLIRFFIYKISFQEFHWTDRIWSPTVHLTPRFIRCMGGVKIYTNARIEGIRKYNNVEFSPLIEFGSGVSIQQGVHITCANHVRVGENTAIAAYVTITDIHHPYDDVEIPIEQQNLEVKEVIIGSDCKIYNGAVILPGVHIGNHVTIGANSVVTHDIPSLSVAVGSPAKVIKHYDPDTKVWVKT